MTSRFSADTSVQAAALPLVELKNCTMEFPGVRALDNVNFTLMPGECHGLVGENGAGKSTLSTCITGENRMTRGELFIEGKKVRLSGYSIKESQRLGLQVVHQEFQLMSDMTGLENIFIGHYARKAGLIDWKTLNRKARELMDFLQCDVNLNVPVHYLRTAEKQIIQFAKAVQSESKVLILDELTAVLQEKDILNIFRIIGILKAKGMGIIYISHRLNEIFECCDSYTVLCDGRHISSGNVRDIDQKELIKMIIGRELTQAYPTMNTEFGDVMLEVKGLTAPKAFRDIDFQVRSGEVIGLAGLVGAGKTELVQAIFGTHPVTRGKIFIKGKEVKIKNPEHAIQLGLGYIPDERRTLGLNMKFDIKENTVLPSMNRFRKFKIFQDHVAEARSAYDINEKLELNYYSLWQSVEKLSGGNQQKIVIAKWMLRNSEIFLLDEPTRGIDVGAKFEIYKLINELTRQGKSVVMVSPELEELIGLCNRIYILYEGSIMDIVEGERKTQEVIISSLLGVNGK
ncbi:putative ribose/galactose/methyl galactoside import ATP-binding protein [uncultured spirochete]|uniref:Putative ribose/galactose/methyl galactoside import ATP-binding protein n=1 Tax=uncultured spirochete TaxID=156406 RepID=A0A3P3XPW1_9SPIR|nr:putative ribose/galactose/methyl galactoside import ATP-binding protein [uncultured spirochete]